jgi:hypothetical protein
MGAAHVCIQLPLHLSRDRTQGLRCAAQVRLLGSVRNMCHQCREAALRSATVIEPSLFPYVVRELAVRPLATRTRACTPRACRGC